MALWKIVNDVWTKRGGEFQSLFFWMALWKILFWDACRYSLVVSILVFLDGALKANELVSDPISGKVSILVFLDGALKDEDRCERGGCDRVSILVFLDGALKGSRWPLVSFSRSSFNPCFSGWRSERSVILTTDNYADVSILVFLDGALKVYDPELFEYDVMFQSLFFWMALWKSSRALCTRCVYAVSILVFLDGALKEHSLLLLKI